MQSSPIPSNQPDTLTHPSLSLSTLGLHVAGGSAPPLSHPRSPFITTQTRSSSIFDLFSSPPAAADRPPPSPPPTFSGETTAAAEVLVCRGLQHLNFFSSRPAAADPSPSAAEPSTSRPAQQLNSFLWVL